MSDRNEKEGVSAVEDTGEGIVPGSESREDAEDTASLDAGGVWSVVDGLEVADAEQEESEVEREEEEEEGDCGAQGTDEHEEGEDEPTLNLSRQQKEDVRAAGGAGRTMR